MSKNTEVTGPTGSKLTGSDNSATVRIERYITYKMHIEVLFDASFITSI